MVFRGASRVFRGLSVESHGVLETFQDGPADVRSVPTIFKEFQECSKSLQGCFSGFPKRSKGSQRVRVF